jgi:sulfide:quinone oxidoreductase
VVVAGGGVAALEVLLGLNRLLGERVRVALLCPRDDFVYRPLAVTEPFGGTPAPVYDLTELLSGEAMTHVHDSLAGIDQSERTVLTESGRELPFDVAVVAIGAHAEPVIEEAVNFIGRGGVEGMSELLDQLAAGKVKHLSFVVPPGVVWALPLYELALLTASWIDEHGVSGVSLSFVTPEQSPLRLFGTAASDRVATMLRERGIALHASEYVNRFDGHALTLVPNKRIAADRVVAVPRLHGHLINGLEQDENGFLRTDGHGLASGALDVYAAGDITSFPVKQGGIAAQQADAVVRAIASRLGSDVQPRPFRPVLRGLLIGGGGPTFMRADITGGAGDSFDVSGDPLWADRGKIGGVHLAEFLMRHGLARSTGEAA